MSSPAPSTAIQRPELNATFKEWSNVAEIQGFIGYEALRVFESARQSGNFAKMTIENLAKRSADIKRASGGTYARQQYEFTTDNFVTEEYGAEEPIDERNARIYAHYFDAEMVARDRAVARVLREVEIEIAAAVFSATTWTGAALTTGITHEWDDYANAVPVDDVIKARQKIRAASGLDANAVILNHKVFENALQCDSVIDRVKYAGFDDPKMLGMQALAALFHVDMILVGKGWYDSAGESLTTSLAPIWSDEYVMVARVAAGGDVAEPCIGRAFHWSGDGSSLGATIESYRDETRRANIIRARTELDVKILYPEAGHLLSNATT